MSSEKWEVKNGVIAEKLLSKTSNELPTSCTREKILKLILKNPHITTAELAETIGISRKGIDWQISRLKKEGRLRRIGSDKSGHWEVEE